MTIDHYPHPETGFGTHRVETNTQTLFRQAPMTAHTYMLCAVHDIDEMFGKGYAKTHPELIAAYMQTSAMDFGAAVIARAVETLSDAVDRHREDGVPAEPDPDEPRPYSRGNLP